jgi:O-acetylhomoserine/O-acetylserine sulfhydrylase-like pyridoxal-dependent enzyme
MTQILPHDLELGLATRAVHAGQVPDPLAGAVMTPIYQTSTYVQAGLGKHKGYEYARTHNPAALERRASLEEGLWVRLRLGLAASTPSQAPQSGRPVVCGENVYGSHRLMDRIYSTFGRIHLRGQQGHPERRTRAPARPHGLLRDPTTMMQLTDRRRGRPVPGTRPPVRRG